MCITKADFYNSLRKILRKIFSINVLKIYDRFEQIIGVFLKRISRKGSKIFEQIVGNILKANVGKIFR